LEHLKPKNEENQPQSHKLPKLKKKKKLLLVAGSSSLPGNDTLKTLKAKKH
jgi:hypothetical protein